MSHHRYSKNKYQLALLALCCLLSVAWWQSSRLGPLSLLQGASDVSSRISLQEEIHLVAETKTPKMKEDSSARLCSNFHSCNNTYQVNATTGDELKYHHNGENYNNNSTTKISSCWSLWLQGENPVNYGVTWEQTGSWEGENQKKVNNTIIVYNKSKFFGDVESTQPHGSCHEEWSWRLLQEHMTDRQCAPEPKKDYDPLEFLKVWKGRTLVMSGDSLSKKFYLDVIESLVLANLEATNISTSFHRLDVLHWSNILFQCRAFQYDVIICSMWGPGSDAFRENSFNMDSLAPFRRNETKHTAIFKDILKPHDVILWNAGVHEGADEEPLQRLKEAVQDIIQSYKANGDNQAQLWWRETLPQHYEFGRFYKKGNHTASHCFPTPKKYYYSDSLGPYNDVTSPIVKAAGLPIFPTYRSAVPLYNAHFHPSFDCTHFCHGKWGPQDLHKSILTKMAKDAIEVGALPPVTSNPSLQQRWDALMEDPEKSVLSNIEVCATDKFSWNSFFGPVPESLHSCLCSSYRGKWERNILPKMVEDLKLKTTCFDYH